MSSNEEIKELAIGYAQSGISVFPCRREEGYMTYEDGRKELKEEKSPLTMYGLTQASKLPRLVGKWWDEFPGALIGIATGEKSGFWVLDIDVPSDAHKSDGDGRDWLVKMEEERGALPDTRIARTANGGLHIFWKHVEGIRNTGSVIAPGVDVRGDGGYIIAPGSVMADGRFYEWVNDAEIAEAPAWLVEMVKPKEYVPDNTREFSAGTQNAPFVKQAIENEVARLRELGAGQGRGGALNAAAFSLGTLVGGGSLARNEAYEALLQASYDNGLVDTDGLREVQKKIDRGLRAGEGRPRSAPEPIKSNTKLRDVTRMLEAGARRAEYSYDPASYDDDGSQYDDEYDDDRARDHGETEDSEEEEDLPVKATPFYWVEPETIPLRDFVFGKHLVRKYVSVTVSPGGVGKTSNSICEALSMTSGLDLVGVQPDKPLNVWIFNAEDPREELTRRAMAAALWYNLKPSDFEDRLFIDSGREQELVIAKEERKSGVKIVEPVVESVVEQIKRNKIDVMIVDPFVSTHGVNENDNGQIDRVAKLWAQIADYTNCAIEIVHHLKKVSDREATVEDARGAVSLIGAARSVRVFNRMSSEQASELGIHENERHGYFSITNGKNNLAPLSSDADWRKLEGQGLGNGTSLKGEDYAPVVTHWRPPRLDERAIDLDNVILRKIWQWFGQNQTASEEANAKDWIGNVVSAATGLVVKEKRTEIKATIARLLKINAIIKDTQVNEKNGRLETVLKWNANYQIRD